MSQVRDCPQVPVSWGELLDKITILQIKHRQLSDPGAKANVTRELDLLLHAARAVAATPAVRSLMTRLQAINSELWEIEDEIRRHEAAGDFGDRFVQLARSVYRTNDDRAAVKREINEKLGSELVEEKSYACSRPSHALPGARALQAQPAG